AAPEVTECDPIPTRGGRAPRTPRVPRPPEGVAPAPAVAPVLPHLESRERAGPVGDTQLPCAVPVPPRRKAEVRLVALPPLHRPVRAVAGRARGDEVRERSPAIHAAGVAKGLPDG